MMSVFEDVKQEFLDKIKELEEENKSLKNQIEYLSTQLNAEHKKNLELVGDNLWLLSRLDSWEWIDSRFKRASIFQRIKGIITGDFP